MDDLTDYAPSRVGRPESGPQGETTALLYVGNLRVPLSVHEAIMDAAHRVQPTFDSVNQPSKKNKAGYIALLRRGLHQVRIGEAALRLVEASRTIRRLLEGAEGIDLEPHGCPRGVDPKWWERQETQRLLGAARQMQAGVREALRISRAGVDTEKELAGLSRGEG